MQFLILLLGVLMFVFYQFEPPPVFFNQSSWKAAAEHDGGKFHAVEQKFAAAGAQKEPVPPRLARRTPPPRPRRRNRGARAGAGRAAAKRSRPRRSPGALRAADVHAQTNDGDYVFITFILADCRMG